MAEEFYIVPESPQYRIDNIRKLQNSDPVEANGVVNPLVMRLLENIVAAKNTADAAREVADNGTTTTWQEITIPATLWTAWAGGGVCREVAVEGTTSEMVPQLTIRPESRAVAEDCELKPWLDTIDGGIRVYAEREPQGTLAAILQLQYTAGTGGGVIATDDEAAEAIVDLFDGHSDGSGNGGA